MRFLRFCHRKTTCFGAVTQPRDQHFAGDKYGPSFCVGSDDPDHRGGNSRSFSDKVITVFAAASLKNALDDVDAAFTKQTGVKVVTSYDASSALMKQIENGAPADAFLS